MKEKIRDYLESHFLGKSSGVKDKDSLFSKGKIDSLGHLKLIAFLEKEFRITLSMEDLSWKNFDSIEQIERLVQEKLGQMK
ncbi:MAG: acyl carrier protein [Oligoflexia bacterium]|nr:acyl carrier protein [Oligoflexia bacterium]